MKEPKDLQDVTNIEEVFYEGGAEKPVEIQLRPQVHQDGVRGCRYQESVRRPVGRRPV